MDPTKEVAEIENESAPFKELSPIGNAPIAPARIAKLIVDALEVKVEDEQVDDPNLPEDRRPFANAAYD